MLSSSTVALSNYRSISLFSIPSKVMKRIIIKELRSFLLDNNVIPPTQHGFVSNRTTVAHLVYTVDSWTTSLRLSRKCLKEYCCLNWNIMVFWLSRLLSHDAFSDVPYQSALGPNFFLIYTANTHNLRSFHDLYANANCNTFEMCSLIYPFKPYQVNSFLPWA